MCCIFAVVLAVCGGTQSAGKSSAATVCHREVGYLDGGIAVVVIAVIVVEVV